LLKIIDPEYKKTEYNIFIEKYNEYIEIFIEKYNEYI